MEKNVMKFKIEWDTLSPIIMDGKRDALEDEFSL